MLDSKVADLLNDQINKEMYSAYLYLDFANFYTHKGLNGYANWYNVQAKEEMDHAIGILQYLQDNDFEVTLSAIDLSLIHILCFLSMKMISIFLKQISFPRLLMS